MPKEAFRRYGSYLRNRANDLGLRDWFITLSHQPIPGDEQNAQVTCTYGRKHALVELGYFFNTRSPEDKRETLIHELLHIHVGPIKQPVYPGTDEQFSKIVGLAIASPLYDRMYLSEELAVEQIAQNIAKFFPLP